MTRDHNAPSETRNPEGPLVRVAETPMPDHLASLTGRPVYTTMPSPTDGRSPLADWLAALRPDLAAALPASVPAAAAEHPQLQPTGNDLYDLQWHFGYLGNIQKIWDDYSGAGVHVGVYDDGLQTDHPDLAANIDPSRHVTVEGQLIDPLTSTVDFWAPHGTAVAGLIGAANNDIGTIGVAWGASLTGVTVFSGPADINNNYAGFLEAASQSASFDVINHSWGKFPGFWQDGVSVAQDQNLLDRWFDALEHGRGGLGTIQVKAAGNADQNSNGDGAGTTRATIVVGAYDDDGDASYYSSYGANLLVSAPSSGYQSFFYAFNRGQVTTDLTGTILDGGGFPLPLGYNGLPDDDYTNGFGGTSGATPIVTGVVALMLDANEHLGWRDVQNILAYSAHEVGSGVGGVRLPDENNDWTYNGADNWNGGGLHYSEDYGYGGVNAYNAVRMAEVWHLFQGPQTSANESSFRQSTTESVALLDGKTTDIQFSFDGPAFTVDFVDVVLDINHTQLDDLEISLISPDGGVTSLIDFRYELVYTPDLEQATLTFGAQGFRGENGAGDWTLRIVDRWLEDEGTLNSASITLHGSDSAGGANDFTNDVYHYTDEVFTANAREGERFTLTDTDGGTDWINASAMTGNLLLRLYQGGMSTAGGIGFLRVDTSALIENAIGGDGNDDITGTLYENRLYGMRGNDILFGGDGDDVLSGGAGNDTLQGGAGSDHYLFDRALDAATNVDQVVDFKLYDNAGLDSIWLESTVFGGLALGTLAADAFRAGTAAADASDRIVYDATTGALYFDADGNGAGAAIQFATLTTKPVDVTAADFHVVDTSNSAITGSGEDRVQPDAPTTSTAVDTPNLLGGLAPINGTQYRDEIQGKDGDEIINGLDGGDFLAGGAGNDRMNGGAGVDDLYGQAGNDELYGGSSPDTLGDTLYGMEGNDVLYGSYQPNGTSKYSLFPNGDQLAGGAGDDILYGYDGDDSLSGDVDQFTLNRDGGNDILYGGNGNDYIHAGRGDDHLHGGLGYNDLIGGEIAFNEDGFDTVHFEGNFDDYKIVGMQPQGHFAYTEYALTFVRTGGLAAGEVEETTIESITIEALQFADRYIDLTERPLVMYGGTKEPIVIPERPDVDLVANGFEAAAIIDTAGNVTITDLGKENGTVDRLQFAKLGMISGNAVVSSDALEILYIGGFTPDAWGEQYDRPAFTGDVTVEAAAGDRELTLYVLGVQLDAGETVRDDTATSIVLNQMTNVDWLNGAAVNDYNLSFASAESIRFYQSAGLAIRWSIPLVTTIDLGMTYDGEVAIASNYGYVRIDTPLDDSLLATSGGGADFRYIGSIGSDVIRLGNLGAVNASNDGTLGADAGTNAGLGLRGTITLDLGYDEVRILGSDAFQGGTIDAGTNGEQIYYPDADVIRMTFAVAEAIGDISPHISNFEVLSLDITAQSHDVDIVNFDNVKSVVISGTAGAAGENTVALLDDSKVKLQAVNDGTHFGTLHLTGSATGLDLSFTAPWVDAVAPTTFLPASIPAAAGDGVVHVADATVVRITTDSRDDFETVNDPISGFQPKALPPVDSFSQVLVLDAATTVTVAGDTGWDFTVAGTDISHVTTLDASGVTRTGTVGAVTATAQTSAAVTFIGGAGDDVFTGGAGDDTLQGGKGNDTYVIDAGSAGDSLVEAADGGSDTARSSVLDLDLNDYTNIENATLTGALDLAISGNADNNRLTGNAGDNAIDGGGGGDTVVFSGAYADYTISRVNGVVTVADNRVEGTDGTDTLTNVEYYEFSDGRRSVNPTAPTDIRLSVTTVRENAFDGMVVGKLTATDSPGDTAAFALLDDAGGRFKLVGDEIRVVFDYLLDYEQATSYDIAVRVTDLDGLTFDKTLTIELTDTNPEFIFGRETDDTIFGGAYNDQIYGNGGNDVLRGNGGSDIIVGGTGDDTAVFSGNFADYEIRFADVYINAFTVTDKRSNADGTGFDGIDIVTYDDHLVDNPTRNNTITVEHLRFADITVATSDLVPYQGPTDIELTDLEVRENAAAGTVVGTLSATDPSVDETFTYALTDDADGRFTISEDKVVVAAGAAFDFETEPAIDIGVQVTDSDGNTFARTFTLGVRDVNEAPSVSVVPLLSDLDETASTATRIAVAEIVIDDDALGGNVLSVSGADAGAFEIEGTTLYLRSGLALDHAVLPQLRVSVLVDDPALPGAPDASSGVFTLSIADVAGVRMVHGTSGDDWLIGTTGNDWFVGGGGEDLFEGGRGDDTYVVDSLGDVVVERGSQGTDTVRSSVSHVLGRAVENLLLTGSLATRGIGNERDNRITGNEADNLLLGEEGDDELQGLGGADILEGGDGHDSLLGGDGDDALAGDDGDDSLLGEAGQDALDGGDGDDGLDGGAGNDSLLGQRGDDTLLGGTGNDRLEGHDGEDLLDGGAHLDQLFGGNGRDTLLGGTGNDHLDGGAGNDHLSGGTWADVLVGGAGRDVLEGGAGYDLFSFSRLDDSGTSAATRDVIVDFRQGWDMIDLESLDADTSTEADDAFRLVGDTFSGAAGELRAYERAGQTLIEADVDGNGLADFSIALNAIVSPTEQDFLL